MSIKYQKLTEEILELAGIKINGNEPCGIQIHNKGFFLRAVTEGELRVGESYMHGWWDSEKVDELIYKILIAKLDEKIPRKFSILLKPFTARAFNLQSKRRAFVVGEKHYDFGNDLFQNMLDKRMNYSCAYLKNADTPDEAQKNKLDLICKKFYFQPGMKVLDIGCGRGAPGKYAAEKYGAEVTGITVSKEQIELGKKLCEGLPVEFRLKDYSDVSERFDRIVSVGMIEHAGYKNYGTYFETANRCLKDDGLFLLHTIGNIKSTKSIDPWTHKFIFPNAMLTSIAQISKAIKKLFVIEDARIFGIDYDKTLMAWFARFNNYWENIKSNFSSQFFRMWKYFLLSSAGLFRARRSQLWQIVLSKNGIRNGYQSLR